jgi:hypothetical protein
MLHRRFLSALLIVTLAGCAQSNHYVPVNVPTNPVANDALQFAVGVATISSQGNVGTGLNVVETLRQSDGLSGTLFNVPTITAPPAFSITAASMSSSISPPISALARGDVNTNRITQQSFDTSQATGFNQALPFATTGAFGYGFCPCNANSGPLTGTPQLNSAYYLPFYAVLPFGNFAASKFLANLQYYGAPPAFPAPDPTVAADGFAGYPLGFTDFAVTPVAGSYRLDVAIPPSFTTSVNSTTPTLTATATLNNITGLPQYPTPSFTSDGNGGGTIVLDAPAGVTESMVFVREGLVQAYCPANLTAPTFYSLFVKGSGAQVVTLPDKLGQNGGPTLCSGATFFVYAAGFDYPAYEAAYPQNTSQKPTIAGSNGQADVTTSDAFEGTY